MKQLYFICKFQTQQNVGYNMTIFLAGATGATGRLLAEQLLNRGQKVKVVVRDKNRLPNSIREHQNLSIAEASLLNLSDEELAKQVNDCDSVASCLGHNITFKGLYGKPRRLVTNSVRKLCDAMKSNQPDKKVKFILMNTTGNRNLDLNEKVSFAQKAILALLRIFLPPHIDNEQAANYLSLEIGQNDSEIEWVAVRPDGLIDLDKVTEYTLHPSPTRSAIFDAGITSRINVAHFMAELITNDDAWNKWKGQMPVIYNNDEED